MLNLPKKAKVNKFIPKNAFYNKMTMSSKIKKEFTDYLEKITWLYKLSEDTLNIPVTENIKEIQIFHLELRKKYIPKNIINVITKGIKYPILFIINYENDYIYSIKGLEQYYSNWNEKLDFNFLAINLKVLYENTVKTILKKEETTKSFDKILETNQKQKELNKQMQTLKSKIKREKQFNRKVELNKELHILKSKMEELNE